jgi:hypothetical protein
MESKLKSDIAESFVTYKLIEMGLEVFLPANAQSKTDLIVKNKEGKTTKVQVKSSTCHDGSKVSFTIAKCNIRYNAGSYKSHYAKSDVDLFICVNLLDMEMYTMPFREEASDFIVRLAPPKNGQVKKVNLKESCITKLEDFA